ncbi:contact-dependent growth inhibition system immunity protein [Sphingomonas sp. ST-64]|uniref:Contact-dependent growth inhibition system immunity protein n=1 Tax=Sphingomonas plantiphila TaxID=3163295 RepID=A0ABW8YNY2_9SPHN
MELMPNDNPSAFKTFMDGYWNQTASDVYNDFGAALSDYKRTEGNEAYKRLIVEIEELRAVGRFPRLADIRCAYADPFWKDYDRIIVQEDVEAVDPLA